MSQHARLSPSSAVRWLNCPAAPIMEDGKPDTSSEYAAEGTAAHYLAEVCLTADDDVTTYQGKQIVVRANGDCFFNYKDSDKQDGDFTFVVNDEMVNALIEYLGLVDSVRHATGGQLFVEQKLSLEHITGEKDATGTSDAVIVADNEIIVIDLKYGQGLQVEAEENPQLMIYGLAAVEEFSVLSDFDNVRLMISQPRRNHVSEWTIPVDDLLTWGKTVTNTAKLIDSLDADSDLTGLFKPSEDGCKYCKAAAECKPYAEFVHKTVASDFTELSDTLTVDDAKYDNDTLAVMFERIKTIKEWIKAVEQATYDKLYAGEPVGDFKLVQGKSGGRKWLDNETAETTLKAMRLKVDDMYDKKVISPTTAEKLHKAGALGDKQWDKLQDLIIKPEGKPSIAPGSDKRPAIITNPVEHFDDLTQTEA